MSHNLKLGNAAADAEGDALAPLFNSGYLRIYDKTGPAGQPSDADRSEESRVGKESRYRWSPYH